MRAGHRHRGGGFPFGRVLAIVIALHVVVGGGGLWLAKTQSGQEFARVYQIKLFEPPKPPEEAKAEPPPPPPPVAPPIVQPTPQVAVPAAASAPTAAAAAPTLGGGGTNWNGKFAGVGSFDGPEGAFHAAVTGRFRKHYSEPPEPFGAAELELSVASDGTVRSYRLVQSSGNAKNDQAILQAAAQVQSEGLGTEPPNQKGRIVTVRFVPSS